jgi:Taurine catabolism dioxygenase TauD, TfdA family
MQVAQAELKAATGASVWTAAEMRSTRRWLCEVSGEDIAELDRALAQVRRQELRIPFSKDQFPLGGLATRLLTLRHEIESGTGVVLMRGLPVDRYGLDGSRLVYWGLGTYLGTALAQTPRAELLIDVRDTGGDQYKDPTARGYHTHRRLPFHNDQGDVVGLLCLHGAKSGGLSCIASAAAVHNEILRTRPDLLSVLYQPYYSDIRGEQPAGRKPYYAEPRFANWQGRLFCVHGRTYIDSAQRFPEVPRLTPEMIEAMELIDTLANSERFRLDMDFKPGDIQFLNNHVVVHSRTDFEDYDEPERKRHLLRLWLRTPAYAQLPPFFDQRFEDMDFWLRHPLPRAA